MSRQKVPVNRTLTGFLTIVCLVSGIGMLLYMPEREAVAAALIRVGLLLGAFWLALPTKTREAAWANVSPVALIGVLAGAVAIAVRPALFRYLLPLAFALLVVGYVLKPREKRRPNRRD
jgi:hypothetical protein